MQDFPTPINLPFYKILESPIIIYLNKYVYEAISYFLRIKIFIFANICIINSIFNFSKRKSNNVFEYLIFYLFL